MNSILPQNLKSLKVNGDQDKVENYTASSRIIYDEDFLKRGTFTMENFGHTCYSICEK